MKWSESESQETPVPASGMLGNASHATPLQTVSPGLSIPTYLLSLYFLTWIPGA